MANSKEVLMDRIEQHEDDTIDLGVASVETKGPVEPTAEPDFGQDLGLSE